MIDDLEIQEQPEKSEQLSPHELEQQQSYSPESMQIVKSQVSIEETLKVMLNQLQSGVTLNIAELVLLQDRVLATVNKINDTLENMKMGALLAEDKMNCAKQKLNRIPTIRKRLQNTGRRLIEIDIEIKALQKWIANNSSNS